MNRNEQLKIGAGQALGAAPGHKRLVLISAGVSAGASLLVALLGFLLDTGIAQTGGLSGMGLRSLLTTAQSLLSMALSLLLPFWEAGYTAAMLAVAKAQRPDTDTLLTGFRRFGPLLRLQLLTGLLTFGITVLCANIGAVLLSLTPLAAPMYEQMLPLMEQGSFDPTAIDPAAMEAVMEAGMPVIWATSALCVAALIPVSYFLRLATVRLLDAPKQGARAALLVSYQLMRGNCLRLFKLDLSFWWFYLGQLAVLLLSSCDVLLPALGIRLPFDGTVAFFAFYALGLGLQLALFYLCRNRVEVTYARFYLDLLPKDTDRPGDQTRSTQ